MKALSKDLEWATVHYLYIEEARTAYAYFVHKGGESSRGKALYRSYPVDEWPGSERALNLLPHWMTMAEGKGAEIAWAELNRPIVARCTKCCTAYTRAQFEALPEVGTTPAADDGWMLVLANCPCLSTISMKVEATQ